MSEAEHVAAAVAALRAVGSNAFGVADLSALAALPEHYTEVRVMERYNPGAQANGAGVPRLFRLLVRQVSKNYANAQNERQLATLALEGQSLTVNGVTTTELYRALSDDPIGLDSGWFSGTSEFAYAL